jgi:hypothetical protein
MYEHRAETRSPIGNVVRRTMLPRATGAAPAAVEPGLLRAGVWAASLVGVAEFVSHVGNELVFDARHRHLDADLEWNLWAWAGSAAIFAAAVAASLGATAIGSWRLRLGLLAAWFAFLSLDDVIEVHERIGIRLGSVTGLVEGEEAGRLWVVVYLPAMAVSLIALLRIGRDLCSAQAERVMHGGLLLIGGAVAAEVLGALTRRLDGSAGWVYDLDVAVEEAAETAGWLLVAIALAAASFAAVATAERREAPTVPSTYSTETQTEPSR